MKKRMIATFIAVILIAASVPALAEDVASAPDMIADVIIARPIGLVCIVVGTAAFIVALPFALASDSVEPVSRRLVVGPFKFTFTRPVGDFSSLNP